MARKSGFKIKINQRALKALSKSPSIALDRFAEEATANIKRRSPFLTGTNRRSIDWDAPRQPRSDAPLTFASETLRRIFATSGYSAFLELGTIKMAARPYFRPGIEATRRGEKAVGKRIKRDIEKAAK